MKGQQFFGALHVPDPEEVAHGGESLAVRAKRPFTSTQPTWTLQSEQFPPALRVPIFSPLARRLPSGL